MIKTLNELIKEYDEIGEQHGDYRNLNYKRIGKIAEMIILLHKKIDKLPKKNETNKL